MAFIILVCGSYELNKANTKCNIPLVIRGQWYSWENGRSTTTEIDATSMSKRGNCIRSIRFISTFNNPSNTIFHDNDY